MQALQKITGVVAAINRANIDTDQIIPKQFLKKIGKTGFGVHLFHDWRYLENNAPNPEFELNRPEFRGARILLAADNFGCGSSREHAPWALLEYGFRVIISTSFADIFYSNCYKNGMLPIVVTPKQLNLLFDEVEKNPGVSFTVDVEPQKLETPQGMSINFDVDSFRKTFLLKGLDDIGWSLQFASQITEFEEEQKQTQPWLWD